MKNIFRHMAALAVIMTVGACSDKWLVPEQPSALDPNNAYSTYTGCMGLVTKLCNDLRPECLGRNSNMKWAYENSDLAVLVNGSPRDLDAQLTPSFGSKPKDFWDETFKSVTRAAMLVSRSATIDGPQEQRDEIRAYGEFFLGYWYYRLITTYGNVPLITEEVDYPKLDFRTSTQQRIINHMIAMLEDAVKYLPDNMSAGSVSKAAGYMILTKYYLMNGDFTKAEQSASAVISTPGLSLMKNRFGSLLAESNTKIPNPNVMTDLFYKYNPSLPENTEAILVVLDDPYAEGGSTTSGGGGGGERMREFLVEWYNGQYDEVQTVQQRRNGGTRVKSTIDGSTGGPGPFTISTDASQDLQILWTGRGIGANKKTYYFSREIWNSPDFENDMRHNAPNWYPMEALVYNVKTSRLYGQNLVFENCSDTLRCWDDIQYNKVCVDDEKRSPDDFNMLGGFQDWYIYRLAEAYLMRAEALVWQGRGGEAAADLTEVRTRAGATAFSGTATLDDVLDERARELFLEEFRRNELVRISFTMAKLGKDGYSLENIGTKNWYYDRMSKKNNIYFDTTTGMPSGLSYGDGGNNVQIYRMSPFHIFWPIPESAIKDNTLAVLNQNYGYVGYENNIEPLGPEADK